MSNVAESGWLAAVQAQNGAPPLLIVADNRSIAAHALAWDRQLTAAGWKYRVRLGEAAERRQAEEAAAVAREAAVMGARSILVAGGEPVRLVAAAAAKRAGLPLAELPPE